MQITNHVSFNPDRNHSPWTVQNPKLAVDFCKAAAIAAKVLAAALHTAS